MADVSEYREEFERCKDAVADNHRAALDDIDFCDLEKQWPEAIARQRAIDQRPMLTINKLPAFKRQVVNDARQNKPSIKVLPVDDQADPDTAEVISGLIRNIEAVSNADVAYDTAAEQAVGGGFGYWRVDVDYAYDDSYDLDILIRRIINQFCVYPDPNSTEADSSDWDIAFVTDRIPKKQFERKYKGKAEVNFDSDAWSRVDANWLNDDGVLIAERWTREDVEKDAVFLTDGRVFSFEDFDKNEDLQRHLFTGDIEIRGQRKIRSKKVKQQIMSGLDILEEKDFPSRYIPIVPVYGTEILVQGKRMWRSLVHSAIDSQRMFNYWRPLSLDTPIPTPSGWTTMGSINVGEQVFDERGEICNVIGKSPVHLHRECFEVAFDDGTTIVADGEHPWAVEERVNKKRQGTPKWERKIVTTAELRPDAHFIDVTGPLNTVDLDLPVHPYVLGVWLGDGATADGRICPGDEDIVEVRENIIACGYDCSDIHRQENRHGTFTVYRLATQLREAGVLGGKRIPDAYLRAGTWQRRALLQGLLDTDGSINRATKACDFTTTNPAIAQGFAELLRSLGIKGKSLVRAGRASKVVNGANGLLDFYQFYFTAYSDENVFGLERKADLLPRRLHPRRTKRHHIVSVTPVASVPVQCIAIDAPSHLFLAGAGMIPTHNTTATELVALAPRVPYIGPKGAFASDAGWDTANTANHPYLEYDGQIPPQRQPLDTGAAAGALQEAINASDDMKSIMGLYDASLGARSNETSGRAILARQREGDVSTFHFQDNLNRAIRHTGKILVDMIPRVYSGERVVRILGEDGTPETRKVNAPYEVQQPQAQDKAQEPQDPANEEGSELQQAIMAMHDLTTGKYDVVVKSGPSFTTRREEAAYYMTESVRAAPQTAPVLIPKIAEMSDWPGAQEIAEELKTLMNPNAGGMPPDIQQMIEAGKTQIDQLTQENQQLKAQLGDKQAQIAVQAKKVENDAQDNAEKNRIAAYGAETDRMSTEIDVAGAQQRKAYGLPIN